jgi:hypothetical protein
MFSAVSSTDLPVMVSGGFFRLAADRYYVPISVAVPGYAVPVKSEKEEVSIDVLGLVADEQGRPLGRMRETLKFPGTAGASLAGKQVLYSSGVTLPPGRFSVKVVVRENTTGKNQKLYFYYEVYDPAEAAGEGGGPQVRTSLAFYRGKVKVFETPVVERVALDAADRKAAVFQFEIPAGSFTPGLYTCQINIIDAAAGRFAFPRLAFYVR